MLFIKTTTGYWLPRKLFFTTTKIPAHIARGSRETFFSFLFIYFIYFVKFNSNLFYLIQFNSIQFNSIIQVKFEPAFLKDAREHVAREVRQT